MHKMCVAIFIIYVNTSLRPKSQIWLVSVSLQESALFLPLLSSAVFLFHVLTLGFLVQTCSQLWNSSVPINRILQDPGISCFYLSPKEGKCFSFPLSPSKNPMTFLGLFLLRKDHTVQEWHAQATCAQKELLAVIIFPTLPLLFANTALILTQLNYKILEAIINHREIFTPFRHNFFFPQRETTAIIWTCLLCTQIKLKLCKRLQQCRFT